MIRKSLQERMLARLEAGRLMSCCSDPPPPPDLTASAEASEEIARINQETAREQLQWAREQDGRNRATLDRVLNVQLPAMEDQAGWAKKDRARYEGIFQPLEEQFVREAQEYDSPERRAEEAGKAIADVAKNFDAQRRNALQRLEGYGVDPSQTRNAALDIGVRTAQAATQAQAAMGARNRVEDTGRAMRGDAINMGKGLPSQAAAGYGGATNSGNSAIGGNVATTGAGANAAQSALGFSGQALNGYGQGAGIRSQGYQNQMQGWEANLNQQMGWFNAAAGVAGAAMMADGGKPEDVHPMATSALPPIGGPGHIPQEGRGDGSGIDDTVPAMVSEGEYIIPADVVKAKGTEFFDKLVERYHTPAAEQREAA